MYWLGGRDSEIGTAAGTYKWLDGSAVNPVLWNGYPDGLDPGYGPEDYMALACITVSNTCVYYDAEGHVERSYICQLQM